MKCEETNHGPDILLSSHGLPRPWLPLLVVLFGIVMRAREELSARRLPHPPSCFWYTVECPYLASLPSERLLSCILKEVEHRRNDPVNGAKYSTSQAKGRSNPRHSLQFNNEMRYQHMGHTRGPPCNNYPAMHVAVLKLEYKLPIWLSTGNTIQPWPRWIVLLHWSMEEAVWVNEAVWRNWHVYIIIPSKAAF